MTREQFRNTLKKFGITHGMLANALCISRATVSNRVQSYDTMGYEIRFNMEDALRAIVAEITTRQHDMSLVHWRFTERNVNADKQRGYGGAAIQDRWRPTTFYPVIQIGGPAKTPPPPPDMRFVLRDVVGEETAVQAFDRLIDTDSKPIRWREAEPVRLAA